MSLEQSSEPSLNTGHGHLIQFNDAREKYQKNSNWWVVYAAFDLPDFLPSPVWIAKRTNLEISEVVEALEGLTTLGFLNKKEGAFYPTKDKKFFNFSWQDKSKSQIIDEHAVVSQQILNQLNENVRIAFDHRCIVANKMIITELYNDIAAALTKAYENAIAQPNSNDGIFKITFSAVDVAPATPSGRNN